MGPSVVDGRGCLAGGLKCPMSPNMTPPIAFGCLVSSSSSW